MRYPDDVPRLTDGVVTLRALTADDHQRIVEQCNDPASIAWTTVSVPYGPADARSWIGEQVPAAWRGERALVFAIEHDGQFAGSVDLRPRSAGEGEVGFGLHPDARGRGVMRRALTLLVDWAFDKLGYAVITWRAHVGNWPSRRVAWATGFHFGPTIPGLLEQRGQRRDAWTAWIGAGDSREPKSRWLETPVLETERLRLRAWREGDGDCLVEAAHDARLRRFIPETPLPRDLSGVPSYLTRIQVAAADGFRLAWCVADRDTDRALGNVALYDFDEVERGESAQVGYWAHPEARGRGVLTEAVRRVADWGLAPAPTGFGLRRLFLLTATSNTASRRVAEQAGFVHVGTERGAAPVGEDGFEDNAVYDRL